MIAGRRGSDATGRRELRGCHEFFGARLAVERHGKTDRHRRVERIAYRAVFRYREVDGALCRLTIDLRSVDRVFQQGASDARWDSIRTVARDSHDKALGRRFPLDEDVERIDSGARREGAKQHVDGT